MIHELIKFRGKVEKPFQYLKTILVHTKSEYFFVSELSANTAAFAKSAAMLGNSEDHTALSRALSQLAEVEEKIDQLHQEQAFADFYMFSELLSDYIRLIAAVKVSFILQSSLSSSWCLNLPAGYFYILRNYT